MKLIERLFGKKETVSPQITFDELSGWLDRELKELSYEIGKSTASVYSEIEDALEEIKKSTDLLQDAKPEGKFHLKMIKVATSNRDNMVKQVRMLADNIRIPGSSDVKTIIAFHENAMQTLTVCLENMMKSYQYTKLVFLEDSKQLITDVNVLGRLLNQLISPINENRKNLQAIENAASAEKALRKMYSDIEIDKKTIKENDENLILLKSEIEEAQNALTRLKESEQWELYLNYTNELAELENKARKTESEIEGLVLPLNKALIRLRQLSESGRHTLAPDMKEGLHLCLLDPKCVSPGFFAEFQKIAEGDALNLAQDKKDKMLEQIRIVESSFELRKKEYQALIQDIEKKKGEKSKLKVAEEENVLNDRIDDLKDKLELSEKEVELTKKHLAALEDGIEQKKGELQQDVSIIDSRVKVLF